MPKFKLQAILKSCSTTSLIHGIIASFIIPIEWICRWTEMEFQEVANLFSQLPPPTTIASAVGSILRNVTGRTISQEAREDIELAAEMVFDIAAQKTRFDTS